MKVGILIKDSMVWRPANRFFKLFRDGIEAQDHQYLPPKEVLVQTYNSMVGNIYLLLNTALEPTEYDLKTLEIETKDVFYNDELDELMESHRRFQVDDESYVNLNQHLIIYDENKSGIRIY